MGNVYYRPTDGAFQYKWSPEKFNKKPKKRDKLVLRKKTCTATPGSQGFDNVVTYVYQLVGGQHLAYVECGYVE